jgi:hypothetical protein
VLLAPASFGRPSGNLELDLKHRRRLRYLGLLLLGVGAIYLCVKLASGS